MLQWPAFFLPGTGLKPWLDVCLSLNTMVQGNERNFMAPIMFFLHALRITLDTCLGTPRILWTDMLS